MDKQLRFTYLQPAIANMLRLLRNQDLSRALNGYDREAINSVILPMLDNAALRIVKLAEPFAPLPKSQDDPDILHVTRTWQFLPGGALGDQ